MVLLERHFQVWSLGLSSSFILLIYRMLFAAWCLYWSLSIVCCLMFPLIFGYCLLINVWRTVFRLLFELILKFSVCFRALICGLVWTSRATSSLCWIRLYTCMFCFGFIFVFFISIVNIWCSVPSLNLMYQNHALVSFGFHLLLAF